MQETRPMTQTAPRSGMAMAAVLATLLTRSEEHTSELQSHSDLVCRLLLEIKKHTSELQSHSDLVCSLLLVNIIMDFSLDKLQASPLKQCVANTLIFEQSRNKVENKT